MHILIVEDDEDIADLVSFKLEKQGWQTTQVHRGDEAPERIAALLPDMVILDIMLPGLDGIEIYRRMRDNPATSGIPALFLTARAQLEDRLRGLELGADDYITKPFSTKELVLRIRNIFARQNTRASQLLLRSTPIVLDKNTLAATLDGEPLELTATEFRLLACLLEREGQVQNRYDLQHEIFGYADTTQSRALDTHIKRLRKKLGAYACRIATERGVGYAYRATPAEEV